MDSLTWYILGGASALVALVLTLFIPVSPHRVNQTLIAALITLFVFFSAFAVLDMPFAVIAAVVGTAAALIYRDVMRWAKEFLWHNVFRYTHRYYWYNRVGRAVLGGGRRRRS